MALSQITHVPVCPFQTEIQIDISHVNQGAHRDNAQLLTLVSEARVRFIKSMGYREPVVEGCPIVVGIVFVSPTSRKVAPVPPAFLAKVGAMGAPSA